jgi:hypothetical protein
MLTQRVLFLTNAQLTAYRVQSGAVVQEMVFATDAAGLMVCEDYLRQHRRNQFRLLVDGTDETFQIEDIPHSSGADRQAILTRKLAQHSYATPYACVHSYGRQKSGRRDERLLLMALAQPQHLEPWIAVLRRGDAVLAGMYSLPQTLSGLLPDKTAETVLLTTLSSAGLRQTFFSQGQMRFSRLTPLGRFDAESYAHAAAEEAVKMHQYLAGQRLIERDKPLTVQLLAHPTALTALRERCRDTANLHFETIDLLEEARRAGLRSPLADSRADPLCCHLLAKKTPAEQFAPPQLLDYYRLRQTRFALGAAAAVILLAAAAFGALRALEHVRMEESSVLAREQTRLNLAQYAAKMQSLPAVPINIEALRAITERYDQAALRAAGPTPLLTQLSRTLDVFPAVTLDRIEWKIVEQLPSPGNAPVQPTARIPDQTLDQTLRGPYAQATVVARLPLTLAGDPRGQTALTAEFLAHLGRAENTWATLLQPPTDSLSAHPLRSGDADSPPAAPGFSFRVVHKL